MGSRILKIEYYLPEKILTNIDLEREFPDWSSDKIERKIGVKQRHVVSENETSLDLAVKAAEKVLKDYDKNKIDFLMLCTQSPDYFLPSSACILQEKLGLRTDIGAYDFNLGCSGFVYGLAMAKSFIQSHLAENVLLITAETYSKFIHPKDRANKSIFGDAAAATIIVQSDKDYILEFDFGTDGSGKDNLIVPNGGLRNKYNQDAPEIDEAGSKRTDNCLYMNGPEIFNFTIDKIPIAVENVLNKNRTTLVEVDYVIFHQANLYMLNYLRKKIGFPSEKFYLNLEETGNTVSSTIPIALKDCLDKKIIKPGNKILLVGFGVGYSWASTIIEV